MKLASIPRTAVAAAAALAVLIVAAPARADHHHVKVAKNDKIGSYLTDAKGATLYVFKKDTAGKSACAGDCVAKWPPYFAEKVETSGGVQAKDFETISRDDGKKQTTYKGMPLYYFSGDKAPGETSGQGVRDLWLAATP